MKNTHDRCLYMVMMQDQLSDVSVAGPGIRTSWYQEI